MKVYIGPYKSWFGPYQLAEALCFWAKRKDQLEQYPEWVHDFGNWLALNKQGKDSSITKLLNWIAQKRKRNIQVKIHHYDTWSMDNTLSHIILPMLQQLKATKHGSPQVEDFDTPQHLWSTNAKPKENPYDVDEYWHQRWEYVLNEMIWAFQQELDEGAEDQFYTYPDPKLVESLADQIHNIQVDQEGLNKWQHRKQNGFRLFGKYYESLWDWCPPKI